jgi:hypothetical protein
MVVFFVQFLHLVAFIMVGAMDRQNHADPSQYAHLQSCRLHNICWEQRGIHTWRRKAQFQPMGKSAIRRFFMFIVRVWMIDNCWNRPFQPIKLLRLSAYSRKSPKKLVSKELTCLLCGLTKSPFDHGDQTYVSSLDGQHAPSDGYPLLPLVPLFLSSTWQESHAD